MNNWRRHTLQPTRQTKRLLLPLLLALAGICLLTFTLDGTQALATSSTSASISTYSDSNSAPSFVVDPVESGHAQGNTTPDNLDTPVNDLLDQFTMLSHDTPTGHDIVDQSIFLSSTAEIRAITGLNPNPIWFSRDSDNSQSVAWGDVDGDGDLDLAVGNSGDPNKLYLNEFGALKTTPEWSSNDSDFTQSVAWGDVDGDGDLDLVVGNNRVPNKLYLNEFGALKTTPEWSSNDSDSTTSVAWGDVDGDGDLDLVVGNDDQPNKLYLNEFGSLNTTPEWSSNDSDSTQSVALGDVDGDGDLDLAVGNGGDPNKLYLNEFGSLKTTPEWSSNESDGTYSVAWGDVDGDGDLDLVVGNIGAPNKLYLNEFGLLKTTPEWSSNDSGSTTSVAWGDVDGDGDLDLAVGNFFSSNKLYLNEFGSLRTTPDWSSNDSRFTESVAWGDVDGDGDLDLVVGKNGAPNKLYLNEFGSLNTIPEWSSNDSDSTTSIAWGDVDSDGDLDLAVGNDLAPSKLYLNEFGSLNTVPEWSSNDSYSTTSVAWGDVDGDGDLDLAVGNNGQPNKLYLNEFGSLKTIPEWSSNDSDSTTSVAWGDVDGDGDLDLAVGNDRVPNKLYLNEFGSLNTVPEWSSNDSDSTQSVAWGDVDGDGDLDLAVGNSGDPNKLYLNEFGSLNTTPEWSSNDRDSTLSIAWGDVDGDGDLDLAVGNFFGSNMLYLNEFGSLNTTPDWLSNDNGFTQSVAWGDVDGDGDLDLAVGSHLAPSKLYLNKFGSLNTNPDWFSNNIIHLIGSVAWGDVDSDGTLDLAVGNSERNKLYLNKRPAHLPHLSQTVGLAISPMAPANFYALPSIREGVIPITYSLFHPAGEPMRQIRAYYSPDGGGHWLPAVATSDTMTANLATSPYPITTSTLACSTPNLAIPDGEPTGVTDTLFIPRGSTLTDLNVSIRASHSWVGDLTFILQHLDTATTVTLIDRPGHPASSFGCGEDNIATTLDDESSSPVEDQCTASNPTINGTFSPNEPLSAFNGEELSGTWAMHVEDAGNGDEGTLDSWCLMSNVVPLSTTTNIHRFEWDVLASGFFGQSDNVVFRIEGLPNLKPITNSIPGPFQRPLVAAQTYPFRVRGNQVQVYSGTISATNVVSNALIYRLPMSQTTGAMPITNLNDKPFRTNRHGYLEGRGQIGLGDMLVALLPITHTDTYTLYHTSATATNSGLSGDHFQPDGVQELAVSANNPLILFDLDLSLEWDARYDPVYVAQLEQDIKRASELLYDWTNGQVALGEVRVYQAKEQWVSAHVTIYAANHIRPSASMGGVVMTTTAETLITPTGTITDAYVPGQISMGAVWSRFGDTDANLGEDWPRALAHELGHYLLFLPDNYLGIKDGRLISTDCRGSAMTNAYSDEYSEFLTAQEWHDEHHLAECSQTIAAYTTGRADWQTIHQFYSAITSTNLLNGPSRLPLAVTQVTFVEPDREVSALATPFFSLRDENGNALAVPNGQGRGYLFKNAANALSNDYVVPLGSPVGDQMHARGAEPGDRLCVYDHSQSTVHFGCTIVQQSESSITLLPLAGWQPQIEVSPVTSVTIAVTVTQPITNGNPLRVQLLPSYGFTDTFPIISITDTLQPLDGSNETFTQLITVPYPFLEGFVRVWEEGSDAPREAMSEFFLDDGWDPNWYWRGRSRHRRRSRANRLSWGAPVASVDGQVTIYNLSNIFTDTGTSSLQALTTPPLMPSWLTPVGQAYRFKASNSLTRTIAFNYLQYEVPSGDTFEHLLQTYYSLDEGISWQPLDTELDIQENLASATMLGKGEGIYVLAATIGMPRLTEGWNLFAYPIPFTRSLPMALESISDSYTTIYDHGQTNAQPWALYDRTIVEEQPAFAEFVNDLDDLKFGSSYWIYATETITPYLGVPGRNRALPNQPIELPPATFYGWITPTLGVFTPTVGMTVSAQINGQTCGQGVITDSLGTELLAYKLQVQAAVGGNGCGAAGRTVAFIMNGHVLANNHVWDNTQAWFHPLVATVTEMPTLAEGWNQFVYPIPFSHSVPIALESISDSYTTIYDHALTDAQWWQMYDQTVVKEQPVFAEFVNDLDYLEFGGHYWIYATETITPYLGIADRNRALPNQSTELPPATFYGWITPTLGFFTPTVGMTMSAEINGQICGQGVITDSVGTELLAYKLQVQADVGGDGCGAAGRTVAFVMNGQRLADTYNHTWDNSQTWFHPLTIDSYTTSVNLAWIAVESKNNFLKSVLILSLLIGFLFLTTRSND